jgi:hypothetical protein
MSGNKSSYRQLLCPHIPHIYITQAIRPTPHHDAVMHVILCWSSAERVTHLQPGGETCSIRYSIRPRASSRYWNRYKLAGGTSRS